MEQTGFITMACPHCGGKRTVKPDKSTVVCDYCGSEYLVNPQLGKAMQESISACPVCHRDDRVEKVSSILSTQIQKIQGTSLQSQAIKMNTGTVQTRLVQTPYNAVQASNLAQKLIPPSKPYIPPEPVRPIPIPYPKENPIQDWKVTKKALKIIAYVFGGLSIFLGAIVALPLLFMDYSTTAPATAGVGLGTVLCVPIPGLLIAGILWFIAEVHVPNPKQPDTIEKHAQKTQALMDEYQRKMDERNRLIKSYQNAVNNWNNLFYCYRDDCIFVPGKGKSAPVNLLQNYLYSA
ncbi:MAG: hypothetical protein PHQ40_10040 [Anaerolineaceae bacterium]|nr:hypothetical protein [Anaerolineaceae bacterium]